MPAFDIIKKIEIDESIRCQQLSAMFDVPPEQKLTAKWKGSLPIEDANWNVGLIVGPSGSGKSIIGEHLFKDNFDKKIKWNKNPIVDNFDKKLSTKEITNVCSSVGFNTIPSWLKPYHVLSNGEKFRVDMARKILEFESPIVIDEFTSVIDRQVAKVACNSIQKFVRKEKKQFIGISCHYDIIDWLRPDWVYDVSEMSYKPRGSLQQRPEIKASLGRISRKYWKIFSKYHYMNADLTSAAKCFALYIDNKPVVFIGVIHLPHGRVKDIKRVTRLVTLPDWQGLGLAFHAVDVVASAYKALKFRLRTYPAHPPFIRSFMRSKTWKMKGKPTSKNRNNKAKNKTKTKTGAFMRKRSRCATFEYFGSAMNADEARKLLN